MDVFSTNRLTLAINELDRRREDGTEFVAGHFQTTYFPLVQTEDSEEIHFDVKNNPRRMAPFVSPLVAGKPLLERGYRTNTFKPAYVKVKTPFDATAPIKRMAGEPMTGPLSPAERLEIKVSETILYHREIIDRRLEWMAATALRTGQLTVAGEDYPPVTLNFGRDPALTVVKSSGAKWSDSGVNPLNDLQDWADLVLRKSGTMPTDVTMDLATWKVFRSHAEVQKRLDLINAVGSRLNLGSEVFEGGVFRGVVDGFNIWTYSNWYLDDAGTEQSILPNGTVIMSGGRQLMGVRAFGTILDEDAGYQAVPFFAKSWKDQDPPMRWVLSQCAPLMVPTRVNASLCATVL